MKKRTFKIFLFLITFFTIEYGYSQAKNGWTIMYYAVGSNSSEIDLLNDVNEMIKGKTSDGYEVIMLIDRIEGYSNDSTALGENFTDTRLYQFHNNTYKELSGKDLLPEINPSTTYEANMGDANLLKKFIQYSKKYYPAKNYMLVMRSHGNGIGMCADRDSGNGDKIYPSEMRDVLTKKESVDILGLDVCSMGGLENFYEWRSDDSDSFSADYILASAPLSAAWAYDDLFGRLQSKKATPSTEPNYFSSGNERNMNPYTMTPIEFSKLMIEEIYDSQRWASWILFDNKKVAIVKNKIDELARLLVKEEKSKILKIIKNSLGYYHNTNTNIEVAQLTFPYVDAYDFFYKISKSNDLKEITKSKAREVCEAIDKQILHSYYGSGYLPQTNDFVNGKNGVYIILPQGDRKFSQTNRSFWAHTTGWFHPDDKTKQSDSYGKYDWCSNGAVRGNNKVDNFFEYLDYLFDDSNSDKGGVNGYKW